MSSVREHGGPEMFRRWTPRHLGCDDFQTPHSLPVKNLSDTHLGVHSGQIVTVGLEALGWLTGPLSELGVVMSHLGMLRAGWALGPRDHLHSCT